MVKVPVEVSLRRPEDVITAVPYLLGYPPAAGLVLLGLASADVPRRGHLLAVAAVPPGGLPGRLDALAALGADAVVAVVYGPRDRQRWKRVVQACAEHGLRVVDGLRVDQGRWWSYTCRNPACCPPEGRPVRAPHEPGGSARVAAGFVFAGLAVDPVPPD